MVNPADAAAALDPLISQTRLPRSAACVVLGILSGSFATLAAVVIAYPAHRAVQAMTRPSRVAKGTFFLANLALSGISIILGIAANGHGPVAVAFPVGVGSNLLSNMVLQSMLGIAKYTKNMRVGTLVLASAVMILPDVGPADLAEDVNVLQLLTTRKAMLFVGACAIVLIFGLWGLARSWASTNDSLLFGYALVGGAGTVVSTSISKLIQMHLPSTILFIFLSLYVVLGLLCLSIAATANGTLEDPSMFVPVSAGVNLILTFIGGLCIWGDWARIDYHLSYCMVYILVVLGTYLVSHFDHLSSAHPHIAEGRVHVVRHMSGRTARSMDRSELSWESLELAIPEHDATNPVQDSVRRLRLLWDDRPDDSAALREALQRCLERGLDRGVIGEKDVVNLCLALAEQPVWPGVCRPPPLEQWLRRSLAREEGAEAPASEATCREVPACSPRTPAGAAKLGPPAAATLGADAEHLASRTLEALER